MSRGWKIGVGVVVAVVALNLLLAGIRASTGGSPGGPASSSYATGATGDAAYASLLARAGHRVVRLRTTPSHTLLDPRDTVVLLDPPFVVRSDARALRSFLDAGGRLVGSEDGDTWLRGVVPDAPVWQGGGPLVARPLAPIPELAGVRAVQAAGNGSWSPARGALPVLGDRTSSVLAVSDVGRGRALELADSSPLQNAYLGDADDARLALALAGPPGRDVVFLESYHGYGTGSGVGAIPGNWQAALLLATAAVVVLMLARVRRFGPPEPEARDLPPARVEYVESLASTLARTRDRAEALGALRAEVRRRIGTRGGLRPDAGDDAMRATAIRLGFPPDEAEAAAHGGDELALGRAFARTSASGGDAWKS